MRQISRRESVISLGLLAVLPIVASAVYWKGQHYDPGLFALDPSLLGEGPARVIPLPEKGLSFEPDGDVEIFDARNLHEKIDGRAELYFEHGFESLQFRSYVGPEEIQFIDVFVYLMAARENAFDIYRLEKPPRSTPVSLGQEGYRVEASYFFSRGRYYVQVIAGDTGPELEEAGLALARQTDDAVRALP